MWVQISVAVLLGVVTMPTVAQDFFKCVGENGRTTYQERPCGSVRQPAPRSCEAVAPNSHEQVQCLAAASCDALGALGPTRSACMRRELATQAALVEQRREAERSAQRTARAEEERRKAEEQRKAALLHREPVRPGDPYGIFVVGARWEADPLAKTLAGFGTARTFPDDSFVVAHDNVAVRVHLKKVNAAGAPVVFEVSEVKGEVVATVMDPPRVKPECPDAKREPQAKGGGWFGRPAASASAPRRDDCK